MKILIVYSGGGIFCSLAKILSDKISKNHSVDVFHEFVHHSVFDVLRQRIRRAGIVKGTSQFIFKVYDLLFLRSNVRKKADLLLNGFFASKIPSLNSIEAREIIKSKDYDVVIAIATSILKEETLCIPRLGFINIHPGVLPQYRGVGNFWAVINKDYENVGCTVHWMTPAIDKGKIILVTKMNQNYTGLWDMNYRAMSAGIDGLAEIINNGSLLEAEVVIDSSMSGYYSWSGIVDFINFQKRCSERNL